VVTRLPDWEDRLSAYLTEVRDRPFEYGAHDCILHACSAVEAMTGWDAAAEFRGQYSDATGAKRALREIGDGTLIRTINARFPKRPVGKAMRGDIVMFEGSAGVAYGAAGLFVGEERLADAAGVSMREGLIAVPRALWSRAWAV
jgi:hypothetical protein